MAAETKASVAARFANGAYVSAEDFSTLVSSYQDFSDILFSIATAAQNGSVGMVYVSGSSSTTLYSAAAQGLRLLNTATTAAAQQQLGGGTVGRVVFEAITTASSQQQLGGGTVGRTLFEVATTAAAQAIVGSVSAATQTEMEAATATGVVATPNNMRWHPGMPKAWASVSGGTTPEIKSSYGIASVSLKATGEYYIVFSTAKSSSNYCVTGNANYETAARFLSPSSASTFSAAGCSVRIIDLGGNNQNPTYFSVVIWGDT